MKTRRTTGSAKKNDTTDRGGRTPDDRKEADDVRVPVCLGEFGLEQARAFRALWEATWSHDARSRTKKKP
jgi:hypothetical protein